MKIIMLLFLILTISGYGQKKIQGSIQSEICTKFEYHYLVSNPESSKDKMPLIVFLHGSGERGTNLELIKIHGPLKYIRSNKLDCIILAPQCPEGELWNAEELYKLIQKVCAENSIDTSKTYLTGLSMGGWGAWDLAYAHPELFAAIVPITGFVDRIPMLDSCKLANIPIRIFHGLLDNVVDVNYSIAIYKKLKECNKDIQLKIFDDAGHDSWSSVYDDPEIYSWMLLQNKKQQP